MTTAALLLGCGSTCELDPRVRESAGQGATSCGRVPLGGDQAAAHRCAVEARRAGRAFWVQWQLQGIDSDAWNGLAFAANGTGYSYLWDDDRRGGTNLGGSRTQRAHCARGEITVIDGREQVICVTDSPLETVCRE